MPVRHGLTTIPLALVALGLFSANVEAAPRRAVIAFVPRVSLHELAALPGASAGLVNATQGRYEQVQVLLDISQGSRTSFNAYDPKEIPPLRVARDRIVGWDAVVRRADAAPAEVVPGLLGSSVATGVAVAGRAAIAGADRGGRFTRAEGRPLTITAVSGVPALRRLLARRDRGTLVLALRAPPRFARRAQLLPLAAFGLGGGRALRSRTTRTDGLVTATDLAPTVLRWVGRPVPDKMQGEPLETAGRIDLGAIGRFEARLRVVSSRRLPTLAWLGALWLVLAAALRFSRRAVRIGALAVLWVLPVLLLFAALQPARLVEEIGVGVAALALAALTDALVPWPRGPAVPAAVGLLAYAIDLAAGSPLVVRSLFGPNPLFGARFYGVGNELEATLPVLMLVGVAAALGARERSRTAALAFAVAGLALGVVLGSGRLGADVGGVITVGAGTAVAVALAAPGRVTGRRIALVIIAPLVALAALAALDLATGGDSHFTRTVLRAGDKAALGDVIARRYELAFNVLKKPAMLVLTPLAILWIVGAYRRRDWLLAGVPGAPVWGAALAGSAAAGVAGALFNDSGPLLLVFSIFVAAWAAAYIKAGVRASP